jgi:vitamin B12 transporter
MQWAFKLPSFFALADPSVGNPNLRPEETRAIDGGITLYPGDRGISLSFSAFRNRFEDLIDFSAESFQLVNRSVVYATGTEAEVVIPVINTVSIGGQATFVDTRIEGTTERLRDRPRWRTGWNLDWRPVPAWRLRPEIRWVSSRTDFQIPVPERDIAPRYWSSDLLVDYSQSRITVFARAQNLTNRKYEEFVGFPNPGFSISVGMTARIRP